MLTPDAAGDSCGDTRSVTQHALRDVMPHGDRGDQRAMTAVNDRRARTVADQVRILVLFSTSARQAGSRSPPWCRRGAQAMVMNRTGTTIAGEGRAGGGDLPRSDPRFDGYR